MKKINLKRKSLVSFSLIVAMLSFLFYAYHNGITGRTMKSTEPGCICHSATPSQLVNVVIEGPDQLMTNQTASYTVRISGGPLVRGGTNIAVSEGDLQPGDGLQKIGAELTHILPKQPLNSEVTFEFSYTAPDTMTTITLYANGNSVNFNGNENGDSWNFADNKMITVTPSTDVEDEIDGRNFYLSQNYPNPFNPETHIRYQISESGLVSLKVFDVLGNEVETLVNEEKSAGIYEVKFSASRGNANLSSGIYYYTLKTNNFISTKKMLMLK